MACLVPTTCGMTDRRKWVCISSYDCSFMFCSFLTFSDGALCYEVGSTTCGLSGAYLKTFFMDFNIILRKCGTHISRVQNRLFISSECPFHTLVLTG